MKLIIAIINQDDSNNVTNGITKAGFYATKLPTTGGFLKAGNVTILIGVEDEKVDEVIEIIKTYSSERSELVYPMLPGSVIAPAVKVNVGGATVFVLDVEQFHKL